MYVKKRKHTLNNIPIPEKCVLATALLNMIVNQFILYLTLSRVTSQQKRKK
jgi:hypothetical protein